MYSAIKEMNSFNNFQRTSLALCGDGFYQLCDDIASKGSVFDLSRAYSEESLCHYADEKGIERFLKKTSTEEEDDCILHRLQLLAYCNPGLSSRVTMLISKAGL